MAAYISFVEAMLPLRSISWFPV